MKELDVEALVAVERAGWDSLCDQTGGAFYGDLMTEDGLMVLVNGVVMDRAMVVESLSQAPAWDSYELSDEHVVRVGTEAACLVYRARARREDGPVFDALMSSTYVMVAGEPKLALYQQTTITH